jgi:hypothetical protein
LHKGCRIYLAERLKASEEDLCSMEVVLKKIIIKTVMGILVIHFNSVLYFSVLHQQQNGTVQKRNRREN